MYPPALLHVFPPEGGRSQWPGKAGSTGALEGAASLNQDFTRNPS
jgi:hypothetical protein